MKQLIKKPGRSKSMTKQEGKKYQARWRLVNEFEIEETRRTPLIVKYRQFLQLVRLAQAMGWHDDLTKDDAAVWKRWQRLRKFYDAQETKF